ncbi:head-to-tail adaptor [Mycobacterium phage Philly]|uniref:Head-to-tail adaptor n=1 Tax=Mycobacterium phage Baloo TaxID=2099645 RepID=A0A2P1CCQ9_9CAUD|nr:head-to-tail adaptor [Mycobacterium phage OrangeOswald]AUX82507.1 head-to-tail adaptor [Mycobacterium phage RagingRooster]AVJ49029.1 head-to-tail adaptor [Mycobacterium phage Baloo]AVJ49287.1 head-to-tail adaptor [Mycobacterium phage ChaChing]AVJ50559.1 head-to-tail adaptor [Mycobacterium phage Nozo]QFG13786.1 head-to-tail adaptor [Mycobacterium phage Philly]QGH75959.1 head-to-tail adaptor [Mycobacterium phage SynergyX]QYW01131.1 head-to-tail adaptor [Mycobacterium phage Yinz]UYL86476.1 
MSCDWPVDTTCLPDVPALPDDATPEQESEHEASLASREAAISIARDVLWALSGRQFGICPRSVRPCPNGVRNRTVVGLMTGYVLSRFDGRWSQWPCGCGSTCRRSGPKIIHLPGPARSIEAVKIGGEVLDPAAYTLEGDYLYRTDGGVWPEQDLSVPASAPGGWEVVYRQGNPVPPGVGKFVGQLAAEFFAACNGGKCKLPRNVTTVTRNGVSYQVVNPTDVYATRKTGLPEVDLWLAAVNPSRIPMAPTVR